MKKLLLILACTLQYVNAQNTIVGEYISTTKNSNGIKLFFSEDNTYQIAVFSGKYKIVNDSLILENDSKENSFNLLFEKGKKASNKLIIKATPYNYYSLFNTEYLGVQKTENSEIEYKLFKDYFDENDLEEYTESIYKAVENGSKDTENTANNPEKKLSFEIERAYALYFVKYKEKKSNIEKYIIPNDVNSIDVTIQDNYLSDLELSGKIENDKSIIFLTDGKSPISFIKKSAVKKPEFVIPSTKTSEKKWSFPGMKNLDDDYGYDYDSTTVVVDTAVAYTSNDFKFNAKVEKNFKEALLNLKKDTLSKHLFVYYNLNDKKAEKNFNDMIEEYNMSIGSSMYSEYDASYDNFNFYLATKSDESFFKKKNIKDKSFVIINKEGNILATSEKKISDITYSLIYDSSYIKGKLNQTENSIQLANSIANKKTNIPELTKTLNSNYKDFFTSNYYYNNNYNDIVETKTIDTEVMSDEASVTVDSAAAAYENNDFKYYKSEISEKLLAEKLNTIFEYYNSKNIVNNELITILIGEISENHTNFNLFKNVNNTNNKQEIKYINYILKYNENQKNKTKIAVFLNGFLTQKETNNPDITTYNAIANSLIAYSENNFSIIQAAINNYGEQDSEEGNKLVDLYYNTLVNDKPIFENIDTQFNNQSADFDYTMDWAGFKNQINALFNEQAWNIFELKKTEDFERAIKWSELSNIVEKNNAYSLDTLGQLYYAVGRKQEAIAIQTKAVTVAKELGINSEEFEEALKNMKK
ncbi:MAG: hypothetical protein A3G95_03940 [Flavobacteria bacterium RIFCSPLOWO2_12_FULL_31_7]|nr:MAG: hypothetical protein A3G95_03940 [Flavobacteria bacterium RIFCSPLOWO2_12_FULL_31_7]